MEACQNRAHTWLFGKYYILGEYTLVIFNHIFVISSLLSHINENSTQSASH